MAIVGSSFIGKTTFCHRLLGKQYHDSLKATINVDNFKLNFSSHGKNVLMSFYDTAGQENYNAMSAAYIQKVDYCILMYAVDNQSSINTMRQWVTFVQHNN